MQHPAITWRPAKEEHLAECLAVNPGSLGAEIVGRAKAVGAWKKLMSSPSFHAAVIEAQPPIGGRRIVGFGASAFVSPTFAEAEISDPKPGMNCRIIASIVQHRSVVLDAAGLRQRNTRGGLSLIVMVSVSHPDLSAAHAADTAEQLAAAFINLHAGYRLKELLIEASNAQDIAQARRGGVFRLISTFDDFHARHPGNGWNRDRALFTVTPEDAKAVVASIAGLAFAYKEPVFALRPAEQALLAAAVDGLTDEELAARLALKLTTIKKRWASIFDRIAAVRPDLLPLGDPTADKRPSRGRQKRHGILAYLREHAEELRPIEIRARKNR